MAACIVDMQVWAGVQVPPVLHPDGGVLRPGPQPLHPAERGAAVPVQLPEADPWHPGQVLHARRPGRGPQAPQEPRPRPRHLHQAQAQLPRRHREDRAARRRRMATARRRQGRRILRGGKKGSSCCLCINLFAMETLFDLPGSFRFPFLFPLGRPRVSSALSLRKAQFAFSVIVKQVLGLSPEEPVTARILEDFLAFMKGLISFPLYIPGTPYAKAVRVIIRHHVSLVAHAMLACVRKEHPSLH
jgi:hypothetical protein